MIDLLWLIVGYLVCAGMQVHEGVEKDVGSGWLVDWLYSSRCVVVMVNVVCVFVQCLLLCQMFVQCLLLCTGMGDADLCYPRCAGSGALGKPNPDLRCLSVFTVLPAMCR